MLHVATRRALLSAPTAAGAAASYEPLEVSEKGSNYSTSCEIPALSDVEDGDLMIAFLGGAGTISAPAGWTTMQSISGKALFYKDASSESGTYTFTHDGSATNFPGMILVYRGYSYDTSSAFNETTGTDMIATSVTTSESGEVLLTFIVSGNDTKTWATGWELVNVINSSSRYLYAVGTIFTSVGATGDITHTKQYAGTSNSALVALKMD